MFNARYLYYKLIHFDQLSGNFLLLAFVFLCGTILFTLIGTMIGLLADSVPQTSLIGMADINDDVFSCAI